MIFEFILIFILYLLVVYAAYYVTEVKRLPDWLQFPPFHCRKCLTFWSLLAVSLVIGFSFDLPVFMATGILLSVLTGTSMYYDEKNKTISLKDYDKLD